MSQPPMSQPAVGSAGDTASQSDPPFIRVWRVTAGYENRHERTRLVAVRDVSLDVHHGEFLAIVGPSGCGKTTLLNVLAGFIKPVQGTVVIDGKPVEGPGADRAMVFQDYALLPWRTVWRNIRFAMENRRSRPPQAEQDNRIRDAIQLVGLTGFEKSYPHELSGGMRQRVGIARALVTDPAILLMDEPFGAVDAMTREAMQAEFEKIIAQTRQTVVFITHSIDEAVTLADRVVVVSSRPGRIKEIVPVRLPRPRLDTEIRSSSRFTEITEHVRRLLRDDALGAREAAQP